MVNSTNNISKILLSALLALSFFAVSNPVNAGECSDAFCEAEQNSPQYQTSASTYGGSAQGPNDPCGLSPCTSGAGTAVTPGTQGFVPLENIQGLYLSGGGQRSLSDVLNTIFTFGLGIAALLAVLMITWGGFQYMLTDTNLTSKEEGRDRITSAIYGLLIILLSYILLVTINPQIANTSILGGSLTTNRTTTTTPPPPPPPPPSQPAQSLYFNPLCPLTDGTCNTFTKSPPPTDTTKMATGYWCQDNSVGSTIYLQYPDMQTCEAQCSNKVSCVLPPSVQAVDSSNNALFPTSPGKASCLLTRGQEYTNEAGGAESMLEVSYLLYDSYDKCTAQCPAVPGGWKTQCVSGAAF